jgi:hypothetical protein
VEFFRADFVDSPDIADGGRAGPEEAAGAFDVVLNPAPRDFADCDFAGV